MIIKAMKGSTSSVCVALVLAILVLAPALMSARHIGRPRSHHGHHHHHHHTRSPRTSNGDGGLMVNKPEMYHEIRRPSSLRKRRSPDPLEIAGSSLPDCSHACGSCSPCRLVMVSFVCASIEEAETCPMAYRCMCKHKSYPVP